MELLVIILLATIIATMAIPFAFGTFILYHVLIRNKKSPADKSNRINHLRLVWFATSREEMFVELFPWMKKDEKENIE